jgi:hypothetical protein
MIVFDFLSDNPVVFAGLFLLVGFGMWQWELFCHPEDHGRGEQ